MSEDQSRLRARRRPVLLAAGGVLLIAAVVISVFRANEPTTLIGVDQWSLIGAHGYVWLDAKRLCYIKSENDDNAYDVMSYNIDRHTSQPISKFTVPHKAATEHYNVELVSGWSNGRFLDVHEWLAGDSDWKSDREQLVDTTENGRRISVVEMGLVLFDGSTAIDIMPDKLYVGSVPFITFSAGGNNRKTFHAKIPIARATAEAGAVAPDGLITVWAFHGIDTVSYQTIKLTKRGQVQSIESDVLDRQTGHTYPFVDLPNDGHADSIQIDERSKRIAWLVSPGIFGRGGLLNNIFDRLHVRTSQSANRILVSDYHGSRFQNVGIVEQRDGDRRNGDFGAMRWLPDGKSISFVDDGELKVVSAQ